MTKSFDTINSSKSCLFKFKEERINAQVAEEMKKSILDDVRKVPAEKEVIFDLDKVEYVSSPFLSLVIASAKETQKKGAVFSIKGASEDVSEILKLVGIDKISKIEDKK